MSNNYARTAGEAWRKLWCKNWSSTVEWQSSSLRFMRKKQTDDFWPSKEIEPKASSNDSCGLVLVDSNNLLV